ncbi:ferritin-like domain-containing protein [Methanothermococcus okinawensis]|uniref:Rubrerythrin n=1 Tax=Methanothermococcus okinawensis (strain DSM 14208 / JCM 11175 / IH1) TaxID=647113 RepID=F8ALQ4_METOI|nr:ferritin family protein [Methanothermococcus okinawensis]AEH06602.1 Rubrerythrin [Methanothermococcus okinawensis IH1]
MVEVEVINEHKIGVTKGTDLEKEVEANFKGECAEVGMYLAMARLAQREGLPEVAEVLKRIAFEEAEHAAHFAEMNGVISDNLKENLEMMLKGECMANKEKKAAATKAKELDIDPAHDFFDESSRDEARHAKMLKGLLDRYFK